MKSAKELLKIASKSTITVLLQGESGTGKEAAARQLHRESDRCRGPFVALNCGAIAKNLAESTLEGAKKGAFTGATADQPGVVRSAHGGTLFLDEIGELPFEMQSKLLRILQERSVMPVGSTVAIPVDFRLVCATNRNLKDEIVAGRFREDVRALGVEALKANRTACVLMAGGEILRQVTEEEIPGTLVELAEEYAASEYGVRVPASR